MNGLKLFRVGVVFLLVAAFLGAGGIPLVEAKSRAKKSSASKGPYRVSARAALLVEGDSWAKTLYEKDAGRKVYPASTTKVLTALIVMERLSPEKIVEISNKVTRVLPSKINLKPGEHYKVSELLYASLLNSANDATVALAEAVAGTEEKFVAMMNARARKLGAKNTLFANSHGLPSEDDPQYTTAGDMVLIFREAMKKELFRKMISHRAMIIHSEEGRKIALRSHNKALFKGWKEDVYGKTGYTRAAQSCFVGHIDKNGRRFYIAVFGCSTRWEDIKYILEKRGGVDL